MVPRDTWYNPARYYGDIIMAESFRNEQGKFVRKGKENRNVYSLRVTDKAWLELGHKAEKLGMTRADLIEQVAFLELVDETHSHLSHQEAFLKIVEATDLMRECLDMQWNQGTKMKEKISQALLLTMEGTMEIIE